MTERSKELDEFLAQERTRQRLSPDRPLLEKVQVIAGNIVDGLKNIRSHPGTIIFPTFMATCAAATLIGGGATEVYIFNETVKNVSMAGSGEILKGAAASLIVAAEASYFASLFIRNARQSYWDLTSNNIYKKLLKNFP